MRIDMYRTLLEHMLWSDDRVFGSLTDDTSHGAATRAYAHVLGAEQIWLARILGAPQGPVWPDPELSELDALRKDLRDGYRSLADELEEADLGLTIAYSNSDGDDFTSTVEEILHHVCLHGAYHRGQVAMLLRTTGGNPAATDFIAYARGAPAATQGENDSSHVETSDE